MTGESHGKDGLERRLFWWLLGGAGTTAALLATLILDTRSRVDRIEERMNIVQQEQENRRPMVESVLTSAYRLNQVELRLAMLENKQ
ncbi:MAG: hypothetical protein EYC70_00520 [Planctomycetota bacterium]|nr:MAG: hypothetical protein EYC70_00520 [Planctomycetota bacterium]